MESTINVQPGVDVSIAYKMLMKMTNGSINSRGKFVVEYFMWKLGAKIESKNEEGMTCTYSIKNISPDVIIEHDAIFDNHLLQFFQTKYLWELDKFDETVLLILSKYYRIVIEMTNSDLINYLKWYYSDQNDCRSSLKRVSTSPSSDKCSSHVENKRRRIA